MPVEKLPKKTKDALSVIKKGGRFGVPPKEIESAIGISKSYCSEIISQLENLDKVRKVQSSGHSVIIYATEFFPGQVEGVLRLGLLKSSEYIPIMTVVLDISTKKELKPVFRFYNDTFELLNDLRSHSIDFSLAPTLSLIQSAVLGSDIKILSGIASGGSGVVQRIGSENTDTLSTEASTMVSMALRAANNESKASIRSFGNPLDGVRKFNGGSCGKIAIWEPYFSKLLSDGTNHCLVKYDAVFDGFPCCSLGTTQDFYKENHELSEMILNEYWSLELNSLNASPFFSKALALLARITKYSKKIIEESLSSYNFKSVKIDRSLLSRFGISLSLRQEQEIFLEDCLLKH